MFALAPNQGGPVGGSEGAAAAASAEASQDAAEGVASFEADADLAALVPELKQISSEDTHTVESGEQPADSGESAAAELDETGEGKPDGEDTGEGKPDTGEEEEPAEIKALREEKEALEAKLHDVAAFAVDPLARVNSEAALQTQIEVAKEVRAWARKHLTEGGEMPVELAQKVVKAQAALHGYSAETTLEEVPEMTAEQVAAVLESSDKMLEDFAPRRQQYLQVHAATVEGVKTWAPETLDPKTPAGQMAKQLLQHVPQLKSHPQHTAIVADWVRGKLAREAEEKAKAAAKDKTKPAPKPTAQGANGKPVPLAPAASNGGRRTGVAPVKQADKATAEAATRALTGKGSEADFVRLLQHAS